MVSLSDENESFFKVGISKANDIATLKRIRLSYIEEYQSRVRCFIPHLTEEESKAFESQILEFGSSYGLLGYSPQKSFSGSGECFKVDIIESILKGDDILYRAIRSTIDFWVHHTPLSLIAPRATYKGYSDQLVNILKNWHWVNEFIRMRIEHFNTFYSVEIHQLFNLARIASIMQEIILDDETYKLKNLPERYKKGAIQMDKYLKKIKAVEHQIKVCKELPIETSELENSLIAIQEINYYELFMHCPFAKVIMNKDRIVGHIMDYVDSIDKSK